MTSLDAKSPSRAYEARGGAWEFFTARDLEVLIEGPAGTGKSFAAFNKLHLVCEKYEGARVLVVRQTRASLTHSGLVTFEDKVLPENHPALGGAARMNRAVYRYPNGSEIVLGGLDNPSKVLSTEFDIVYVQEATEISEGAWETLMTRLRNGRVPYQQIIADCNPDRPTHWLNQRCNAGKTRRILSRHEDNPEYFRDGAWTPAGLAYIARLEQLTGPRLQRLRYGRWAGAEGLVYEGWDPAIHLVDREQVPEIRRRFWVVDFGYTNPFVWQEWGECADGDLYRLREIYKTQTIVDDHAEMIRGLNLEAPSLIVCDHDAEDRATLERKLNISTIAAKKDVLPGINAVTERLRKDARGRPRLYLVRGALVHAPDEQLADAKKPTCTEQEFDGYQWEPAKEGKAAKEAPAKVGDHGMDAMRYLVMQIDKAPTAGFDTWLEILKR